MNLSQSHRKKEQMVLTEFVLDELPNHISKCNSQTLANLLIVLPRSGVDIYRYTQLFQSLLNRTTEIISDFTLVEIARITYSFTRIGISPSSYLELMTPILNITRTQAEHLKVIDINNIINALTKFDKVTII